MNQELLKAIAQELRASTELARQNIDALRGATGRVERQFANRGRAYPHHHLTAEYFGPTIRDALQRARDSLARYEGAGADDAPGIHPARAASFRSSLAALEREAEALFDDMTVIH